MCKRCKGFFFWEKMSSNPHIMRGKINLKWPYLENRFQTSHQLIGGKSSYASWPPTPPTSQIWGLKTPVANQNLNPKVRKKIPQKWEIWPKIFPKNSEYGKEIFLVSAFVRTFTAKKQNGCTQPQTDRQTDRCIYTKQKRRRREGSQGQLDPEIANRV